MNKAFRSLGRTLVLACAIVSFASHGATVDHFVEYVESTGTQWFDTGYMASAKTTVEADFQWTQRVSQGRIFGNAAGDFIYVIYQNGSKVDKSNGKWAYAFQDDVGNWVGTDVLTDTGRHTLLFDGPNRKFKLDGGATLNVDITTKTTAAKTATVSMAIGAARTADGASSFTKQRIFSFKIFEGGVLQRDYLPCVDSDGKASLYDALTGELIHNAAESGDDFTVGPVKSDQRIHAEDGLQFKVTVSCGAGGTVSPSGEVWVKYGETLEVTATPADGGAFGYWAGDVDNPAAATQSLTITVPRSLYASFSKAIYVTEAGADDGFGTRDSPMSIATAAKIAAKCPVDVTLAKGRYGVTSTIYLETGSSFVGETGNPEDVVVYRKNTGATYRIFYIGHADDLVANLVVEGGAGHKTKTDFSTTYVYGAGLWLDTAGGTVSNCIFRANKLNGHHGTGGGLVCYSESGLVTHCVFSNNTTSVYDNNAAGTGASMKKGRIDNCFFYKNNDTSSNWGGQLVLDNSAVAENCTVVGAKNKACAGIYTQNKDVRVRNCVIADNETTGATASWTTWGGTASCFTNCYSDVNAPNANCHAGADLTFVDAAHGDYRLASGSAAIDVGGEITNLSTTDLDGMPRYSGPVDAGCYEYDNSAFGVGVKANIAASFIPFDVTLTAAVSGTNGEDDVWIEWDLGADGTVDRVSRELEWSFTQTSPATVDIAITAVNRSKSPEARVSKTAKALYVAAPRTLRVVDGNPNAAEPYDTWANAAATLQAAIDYALDGAEIVVSNGVYELEKTVNFDHLLTVRGLTGNPEDVVFDAKCSSSKTGYPLNYNADKAALLAGVTVQGGYRNDNYQYGGGIYIHDKGGIVSNCIVRNNHCGGKWARCGGIAAEADNALVTHCVISNNTASTGTDAGDVTGIAVHLTGTARLEHSLVIDNRYTGGSCESAICVANGAVRFCTIVGNKAMDFGGVNVYGAGKVEYCIIAGNSSYWYDAADPATERYKVWGANTAYVQAKNGRSDDTSRTTSAKVLAQLKGNVADSWTINDSCPQQATDAIFVRYPRILRPRQSSAALDIADPADLGYALPELDVLGRSRVRCNRVDAGCIEGGAGFILMMR